MLDFDPPSPRAADDSANMLPPEAELKLLQDRLPPFPGARAREQIEAELGARAQFAGKKGLKGAKFQ